MQEGNSIPVLRPSIKFQWVATYSDNTELFQNYLSDDEHNFGHINQDRLISLSLVDENNDRPYSVNVVDGTLTINGQTFHIKLTPENKTRLIYFRRIRTAMHGSFKDVVIHAIGLQSTFEDKNYQFIALISESGTIEFVQKK